MCVHALHPVLVYNSIGTAFVSTETLYSPLKYQWH